MKKRIVWTLAVLLALSFVAVVVLLHSPRPKVIGNLSKEDVTKISGVVNHVFRDVATGSLTTDLRRRRVKHMALLIRSYLVMKIRWIKINRWGQVIVGVGTSANEDGSLFYVEKYKGEWVSRGFILRGSGIPFSTLQVVYTPSTNTAPVSQRGVGK